MKKKIFLFVFMIMMFAVSASASHAPIVDEAGYLSDSEREELSRRLEEISDAYDFDVSVVIEEYQSGDSAMESADDIYDNNAYGTGEDKDGLMLYLSKEPREYHFVTVGYGLIAFNGYGLTYLEDEVTPYLKNDEYYEAINAFADAADELLEMAVTGEPYGYGEDTKDLRIGIIITAIAIPLIVAFAMTAGKSKKMNNVGKQTHAKNYIKEGSMNVDLSRDIYMYSTVDKTQKVKYDSESDGAHTTSSGSVHGGRGGSY